MRVNEVSLTVKWTKSAKVTMAKTVTFTPLVMVTVTVIMRDSERDRYSYSKE